MTRYHCTGFQRPGRAPYEQRSPRCSSSVEGGVSQCLGQPSRPGPQAKTAGGKSAIVTPGGLYHYTLLPFGVHDAPTTFQHMMDRLLRPHQAYATAYIDDIIVHSASWDVHLRHLWAVLGELRKAGLVSPGLQSRMWERPAPGCKDKDHPGLAPPHHQETGVIFPRASGVLSKVHSWFRHTGKPPP